MSGKTKAFLNKSSLECPGVAVFPRRSSQVARTKTVAYTRADLTIHNRKEHVSGVVTQIEN
jgi:hypothetical protein